MVGSSSKPHWEPVRISDKRVTDSKAENNYDVTFQLSGDHYREEWRGFLQSSEVTQGQISPDFQVSPPGTVTLSGVTKEETARRFKILEERIHRANEKMEKEVIPGEHEAWSDRMDKQREAQERKQKMQDFLNLLPSGEDDERDGDKG